MSSELTVLRLQLSRDTLQYRLEDSIYHWCTWQVTQLFTYLLSHKLF